MLNVSVHTAQLLCLMLLVIKSYFILEVVFLFQSFLVLAVIASKDIVMQFVKSGDFGNGISCVLHV